MLDLGNLDRPWAAICVYTMRYCAATRLRNPLESRKYMSPMTETITLVQRLYILDYGLFQVHANGRIIGIPGYLIQTSDGRNILVDTGFPQAYADDPVAATIADGLQSFGHVLQITNEQMPAAQLARIGLRASDITQLVLTHSDVDHIGNIADFAHVPIIIGRAERALAEPRYFNPGSPIAWPDPAEYQLIDQDTELLPGLSVLATPGHSSGHLSLLVRLPQTGLVVLAADAISRPAELAEGFNGAWDEQLARIQAERLIALAEQQQAFLIYGHDPAQWPRLRKAPSYYD